MSDSEHDWLRPEEEHETETVIDAGTAQSNPEVADAVAKIAALRQSIDNVDTAIVSLLAERFKYTSQVGVLKARAGFAPGRFTSVRITRSNGCTALLSMPGWIPTSPKCIANSW